MLSWLFKKKDSLETQWIKKEVAEIEEILSQGEANCLRYRSASHPRFWRIRNDIEVLNSKPSWFNSLNASTEDLAYCKESYRTFTEKLSSLYQTYPQLTERLFREYLFNAYYADADADRDFATVAVGHLQSISPEMFERFRQYSHVREEEEKLFEGLFLNGERNTEIRLSPEHFSALFFSRVSPTTTLDKQNYYHIGVFFAYAHLYRFLFSERSFDESIADIKPIFCQAFGLEVSDEDYERIRMMESPSLSFMSAFHIATDFKAYDHIRSDDSQMPMTHMSEEFYQLYLGFNKGLGAALIDTGLKRRVFGLDFQGERTMFTQ